MYTSYQLTPATRKLLLDIFPPKHKKVIAHHITHEFGVHEDTNAPPSASIRVVGYHNNPDGIEALVVSVDGSIDRLDGRTYHITWSLNPEKFKPVDSNKLVSRQDHKLILPIPISTNPSISK